MNKAFGHIHTVVALVVLLYYCLGSLLGDFGSDYWDIMSWAILITTVIAVYFGYQHRDDMGSGHYTALLCMAFLVVHQGLAGIGEGGFFDGGTLSHITIVLYIVYSLDIGKRLKAA